jgi:hypothetical protein
VAKESRGVRLELRRRADLPSSRQIIDQEPIPDKDKKIIGYQEVITDPGEVDKRLMGVEEEFGRPLKVLQRDGSTLSAVVRQALDGGFLGARTKCPMRASRASNAHVSAIGHRTPEELRDLVSSTEIDNGFLNRFLIVACRKSKMLPRGAPDPRTIEEFTARLASAKEFALGLSRISLSNTALSVWDEHYPSLTREKRDLGNLVCRAQVHVMRLAVTAAVRNQSRTVEPEHLPAALAIVASAERSTSYVFGAKLGDKDHEAILRYLTRKTNGASRSEIRRDVFGDHKAAHHVHDKLASLLQINAVRFETPQTKGRPKEAGFACNPTR